MEYTISTTYFKSRDVILTIESVGGIGELQENPLALKCHGLEFRMAENNVGLLVVIGQGADLRAACWQDESV